MNVENTATKCNPERLHGEGVKEADTESDAESIDFARKLAKQFEDDEIILDDTSDVVFDIGECEDIPDSFDVDRLLNIHSQPVWSAESINKSTDNEIISTDQSPNTFETRKASEVGRCMYLYRLLSEDLSIEDDDVIEIDGDPAPTGTDCVDGVECVDRLDDVVSGVYGSPSDLITFIKEGSGRNRSMMASYLSTGRLSDIILTPENFHLFLHVAITLGLRQLKGFCIKHYFERAEPEDLNITGNCTCMSEIRYELQKGFRRSLSVASEDNALPEYYIAFSKTRKSQKSQEKVTVVVINMTAKRNVLQRVIEKPLGKGFACCSVELKDSPFIFISGGENRRLDQFWKYDVIGNRWDKQTKLIHGRSSHLMTACDNSLYVIGGKEVSCIEKYDVKEKKWKDVAFLATPVHMAISVLHDRLIYIFGGKTLSGPVSTVQRFDILTNTVERLQDLPCPVYDGQAVIVSDYIYIASGQGHMIFFEPSSGVSNLCSNQPIRRERFGMFVKNDRVYMAGGEVAEEDKTENNPQYRYDPDDDCWVEKYELNMCYPVYASCIIRYPKKCPIIPFDT